MNTIGTRSPAGIAVTIGTLMLGMIGPGTGHADDTASWETMEVTATSFTLAEEETKRGNVGLTAFGDQLKPTSKAVAVSRDLIDEGLTHGTKIRIEGLPGTYTVQDKMHRRWRDKIDILFAKKQRARNWGRQKVEIQYLVPDGE
ncbi:3D domain-containing protein [Salinisphaera aquimarina]|uniref:3D domain-containing protein n=1 Tax=Salinisphaera aquimarina TaxID=2094031 RepID=A0ABV7EQ21_9GAMM